MNAPVKLGRTGPLVHHVQFQNDTVAAHVPSGSWANSATATTVPVTVIMQNGTSPEQTPLQPANREPGSGHAVRTTGVSGANVAEHVLPQPTPAGLLLTVPNPAPVFTTATMESPPLAALAHAASE